MADSRPHARCGCGAEARLEAEVIGQYAIVCSAPAECVATATYSTPAQAWAVWDRAMGQRVLREVA